jgi:hypothetical protein
MGYLQPSRKSRKHRHKHEQQQEYCLHGLYASTTNHQPTNRIDPPLMSDRRSIVYYLPASEHKMLKSSLARQQQSSYRLASGKRIFDLYEFLIRHGIFCSGGRPFAFIADRRSANVVV